MDKQPQNTKCYVDKFDIMQRYGVGQEKQSLLWEPSKKKEEIKIEGFKFIWRNGLWNDCV